MKIANRTIYKYPELEPSSYPGAQEWADFIKRMSEPGSEMARMDAQYEATIKQAIDDRIRHIRIWRVPTSRRRICRELAPAEPRMHKGPETCSNPVAATKLNALTWQDIELRFLSEERVQIITRGNLTTHNYAELGFEDLRNGAPNSAWETLSFGSKEGEIGPDLDSRAGAHKVEKRIQEIRKILRGHFSIDQDPVPLRPGIGYKTAFRIVWSLAANA